MKILPVSHLAPAQAARSRRHLHLLDAGAADITDEMLVVAARAIAATITDEELNPSFIIPSVFDPEVSVRVAEAVAHVATPRG